MTLRNQTHARVEGRRVHPQRTENLHWKHISKLCEKMWKIKPFPIEARCGDNSLEKEEGEALRKVRRRPLIHDM